MNVFVFATIVFIAGCAFVVAGMMQKFGSDLLNFTSFAGGVFLMMCALSAESGSSSKSGRNK